MFYQACTLSLPGQSSNNTQHVIPDTKMFVSAISYSKQPEGAIDFVSNLGGGRCPRSYPEGSPMWPGGIFTSWHKLCSFSEILLEEMEREDLTFYIKAFSGGRIKRQLLYKLQITWAVQVENKFKPLRPVGLWRLIHASKGEGWLHWVHLQV